MIFFTVEYSGNGAQFDCFMFFYAVSAADYVV